MVLSEAEENYIKCIYKLSLQQDPVSTNAVSAAISTTAASVTDMVKKLSDKGLLHYVKYKGVSLSEEGHRIATTLVRKHRLWEVFLVDKLKMKWDEVHEIAEQLEHIRSPQLIQKLDDYLGNPRFDPHGDPIPDQHGNVSTRAEVLLSDLEIGSRGVVVGVRDHSTEFLQYLTQHALTLGTTLKVLQRNAYDNSLMLELPSMDKIAVSQQVAGNLYVSPVK